MGLEVSVDCIHKIWSGRAYKTLKQNRNIKIGPKERVAIRSLSILGKSDAWLAVKYGVSVSTIQRVRTSERKTQLRRDAKVFPEMRRGLQKEVSVQDARTA